jgi:hypothetical protein
LERHLQGVPATLSMQLSVDGVATDPAPDSATVRVVDDAGIEVVPSTAAANNGTGGFTLTLTPAQTALLDVLKAYWTVTIAGEQTTLSTIHEIVGGFLFAIADMRKRLPDTTLYPTSDIAAARTWAETEIENACGIAFVPRYARETLNGSGAQRLEPKWPRIRTLRGAVVDGVPMSTTDLAGVVIELERFLTRPYGYWRPWVSNVLIRYEHGLDTPPPGITAAAIDLARYKLINDAGQATIDPRADRVITEDGTITLGLAGINGRFGIPTVDAAIDAWSEIAVY